MVDMNTETKIRGDRDRGNDEPDQAIAVTDRVRRLVEPPMERPSWTFLTNHAHVMVALSRNPDLRQRDLAYVIGITPGAVQRILDDLVDAGYVERERVGRRNHYEVLTSQSLRHPLEEGHNIGELLDMLQD